MKITIQAARNGATVMVDHEEEEDMLPVHTVYQFDSEDPSVGLDGLLSMLYAIADDLGQCGNKYAKERLGIRLVHGEDFECDGKDCPICEEDKCK